MPYVGHGKKSTFAVDGYLLTQARLAAGLRLRDIAEMLGTGKGSVSRWELGTLPPSEDRILELVRILKTDSFVKWNAKVKPLEAIKRSAQ